MFLYIFLYIRGSKMSKQKDPFYATTQIYYNKLKFGPTLAKAQKLLIKEHRGLSEFVREKIEEYVKSHQ